MSTYSQLQEKLNGHPYNGYFTSLCVFHSDHSPSFFVWEDGRYRCKTCGASGTNEYLLRYLGGHEVKAKKGKSQVLPQWIAWENKWGDLEGIARHAHESCKRYPQWMFYFKERKIDEFFELGYFGYIEGWVTFPVFDEKRKIQNIVARHTKRKDVRYAIKHLEDNHPILYCPNWNRVKNSEVVYVPFGIIDSWAFESLRLASVTGITGKSLSAELLKSLGKQIVIIPDEWEENEAYGIANLLGWRGRVKRISYPEGVKDPDGLRTRFGNEYLLQVIGV